jgi:hypothetical protein
MKLSGVEKINDGGAWLYSEWNLTYRVGWEQICKAAALLISFLLLLSMTFGFGSPLGVNAAAKAEGSCLYIDTCISEALGNNEYRIIPGYADASVKYRIGDGKWKEVRKGLKEQTAGSYYLALRAGETVSIKVNIPKDVPYWNASFGTESSGPNNFGPVSVPMDFDPNGFFSALTSEEGYTFTAEDAGTYRLAVDMGKVGSAAPTAEEQYKYFLDFSKFGTVSADGSKVTFDVGGKKVVVTVKGGSFKNGGVGIPEDLSRVVFILDSNFDASTMSVYIQETERQSNPFVVDLWAAKGTNEVSLDKSDIGSGHWPAQMSFVIGRGKTKTYTPEPATVPEDTNDDSDAEDANTVAYTVKIGEDRTATLLSYENPGKSLSLPSIICANGAYVTLNAIGKAALSGSTELTKLVVPSSVKTIGKNAFKGCSSLKTVVITADSNIKVGAGAFEGIASDATVKINAAKKIYKKIRSRIISARVPDTVKYKRGK